jgi:hypothetical protein
MLIIFQALFSIFAVLAILAVIKKSKENLLGPKGVFFWITFWVGVLVVVFWPESASLVATKFGIGRGSDFVFYLAFVVLFYLVFRLHIKIESVGRDITRVVRKLAMDRDEEGKKD